MDTPVADYLTPSPPVLETASGEHLKLQAEFGPGKYTQFVFGKEVWTLSEDPTPATAACTSSPRLFIEHYLSGKHLLSIKEPTTRSKDAPFPVGALHCRSPDEDLPPILPAPTQAARAHSRMMPPRMKTPSFSSAPTSTTTPPTPRRRQFLGQLEFDEVYLIAGVCFNSKTHEIVGFAGDFERDICGLEDLYFLVEDGEKEVPEEATRILQFCWKDLHSKCCIMGPWFDTTGSMSAETLLVIFWEVLRAFSDVGLDVMLVVADGCQTNLSLVKLLCGIHKDPAFPEFELYNTSCLNPLTGMLMFFITDPPHMCTQLLPFHFHFIYM
jgi:hypothetical protein